MPGNVIFQSLEIEGLKKVSWMAHRDERGYFGELYRKDLFLREGLEADLIQWNLSQSAPHVLRGLHGQIPHSQTKYLQVIAGEIFDVIVDLRPTSQTYCKVVTLPLSAERGEALWIPAGCVHGFCVLGDQAAHSLYGVDRHYDAEGEIGVRWDDPALAIRWPYADPLVSAKDQQWPPLAELCETLTSKSAFQSERRVEERVS